MEYKVNDKTIKDKRVFSLKEHYVMTITLDKREQRAIIVKDNDRIRLFVLHLINQIQKESLSLKKENCNSYKMLDVFLGFLYIQTDLICGDFATDWYSTIVSFVDKKIGGSKIPSETKDEMLENIKTASILNKSFKVLSREKETPRKLNNGRIKKHLS